VTALSTLLRQTTSTRPDGTANAAVPRWLPLAWVGFVVAALLMLPALPLVTWGVVVAIVAAVLVAATAPAARGLPWLRQRADAVDLVVIAGLYLAVVGLYRLAFVVFTTDNVAGLFLSFAGGLILGVVGPVAYTTWIRHRPLRTLGLGVHNLRPTVALAVLFGGVQFVIMFGGYTLPAPVDWVPLLVLSLTVGLFEAVFFRGFVQTRLEASFGIPAGVVGAAVLYALYHVGYGMTGAEMVFLFGLGVVYAIAYRLAGNILVLWPLLTPIGAFFNNLQAGDIVLPWPSIAGFADVLAVMAAIIWLAARHERRATTRQPRPSPPKEGDMTTLDTHDDQLRAEALEQLRKRSEFWAHLAAYLLVNTFLVAIWFIAGAGFFWPMFPLFGWGIGLFFHAWDVFRRPPSEEQIRREIKRLHTPT
jgi:membrane protease YdiL (CAAX protease family)